MKKKILALLLTVMTVVLLVPAIVASAVAPVALAVTENAADNVADDRAEVEEHNPLLPEDNVEVLNKDGVRVGYYRTLAEAVADLREGDTVNLLDDIEVSSTVELFGSFTLNGNGYVISYGMSDLFPTVPEIPGGEGEEPSEPENGGDIDGPVIEGGEPTDPDNGDIGGEPTDPDNGDIGGEPTDPDNGDIGGEPTDPDNGDIGGEPTDPDNGDIGGEPTDPDNGDIGGEPTDPDNGGDLTDPEGPDDDKVEIGDKNNVTVFAMRNGSDDTTDIEAPAVEMPTVALSVVGNGTNVVIKNLTLNVPEIAMGIELDAGLEGNVAELTLYNCFVSAADVAVMAKGSGAYLTVKGMNGSYFAEGAAIAISGGFADIYGGSFLAGGEVLAVRNATVAVYEGLFEASSTFANVVSSLSDAIVILAGGEYATAAYSEAPVLCTEGGEIKVLDGKYYQSGSDLGVFEGDGVEIYDGFFYGQSAVSLDGATVGEAYATNSYTYEDPTFPANTKLDVVKEMGYYSMVEVVYDAEWLSVNDYDGTAYDVTNGVYNDYPVSYYAFEIERAYWYLGNGGSLTVTRDVELALDSAITFRARPQSSVVTLCSAAKGENAFTLCINSADHYALVTTGGTYNISNLKLVNDIGSTVLLDQDQTDEVGSVLNLYSGAAVAGYQNHAVLVGAYSTMNMYDGAYAYAAAGTNGRYDGTGFGVITLVGGCFNMYGGNLGYTRVVDESGRYADMLATGKMNTVAVGVGEAATCVSGINIYGGKLGKSNTDMSNNATAILNLTEQSERIDGTKVYIENGEFNSAMNSIIRCGDRNVDVHIKGGTFNGPTVTGTNIGHSDLICVNGLSADVHNRLIIEGGSFFGGRDQINIRGYAAVSVSNSYHAGGMSAIFSLLGNPEAAPVTVTDITVETTVTAFWCEGSALIVTNGKISALRNSWGHAGFAVTGNAEVAGDIIINGGVYNIGNGYLVGNNGTAKRTVTLNEVTFNSAGAGGSGICMNDSGRADVIVNGGVYSNMLSSNHQIETWGDPAKTVGSLTINGDARFVRGGTASGRMIKYYGANNVTINGGYFQSTTSETMVIEKSADKSYEPTLTLTINGGTFYNNAAGKSILYFNSTCSAALIINGGTFLNEAYSPSDTWAPCLDYNSKTPANIYGGDFSSMCPSGCGGGDSCVTVGSNATLNVYAGSFRGNGMCVIRGLAGKTDGETNVNGSIQTVANCHLNIYGGVFTLEANTVRTAGNYGHDAVVRCGGGSTYAFVSIYGGTFIDNSTCSNQVISKNNVHSSITITGGVFMASGAQEYYYKSNGMANTGGSENPKNPIPVGADDPTVNYGDKLYKQYVMGTGASPFNGKMEDGAQIRLIAGDDGYMGGLRFVTRYSAASVTSLKSLAGGDLNNVTFGTLIIKAEDIKALNEVNHAALDGAEIAYIDVVAKDGISGSESAGYTITAAISNIAAEDYSTAYAAIGYVKVDISDDAHVYFYTNFDKEANIRSLSQVAEAALADVSESQTKGYVYAHITMDGMYSRYTEEQQAVLLTYVSSNDVE